MTKKTTKQPARKRKRSYTKAEKEQACIEYNVVGSYEQVSKALGVPKTTLHTWSKSEWWQDLSERVRTEKDSQHVALYDNLTRSALSKAQAGIDQLGDTLSANDIKALVVTGATATDKSRIIRNQAVNISGSTGSVEAINNLAKQFRELSRSYQEKKIKDSTAIEGREGQKDDNEI